VSRPLGTPHFVSGLVRRLRYHGMPIGVDDLIALRRAMAAGFGWRDTSALRELCVMLWATGRDEAALVRAMFNQGDLPDWDLGEETGPDAGDESPVPAEQPSDQPAVPDIRRPAGTPVPEVGPVVGLAQVTVDPIAFDPTLILAPHYPVSAREIAQAWRRLRRSVRQGPAVEVDVAETLRRRGRNGLAGPPVLVPRYRNTARLLLLIDRQGSMTPFHGYADHLRDAIQAAARVDTIEVAYFHDTPDRRADRTVLAQVANPFDPRIDDILHLIDPMTRGTVYQNPALTRPRSLDGILGGLRPETAVAVISDAGAARQKLDAVRLVETVAMIKALRTAGATVCWLNPARRERWDHNTAGQLARHVPMFPLTRTGMYGAVEVLRGRPGRVERPV
jgi:hypothetical protein